MATRTFASRRSVRRSQSSLLERGVRHVDGRRHAVVRRASVPRGTPHDVLVEKVLERMMVDEARRIAF
jgi:hypothetical protein